MSEGGKCHKGLKFMPLTKLGGHRPFYRGGGVGVAQHRVLTQHAQDLDPIPSTK